MAERGAVGAEAGTEPRPRPPFWVLSTYFAEGFPYSLVLAQLPTVFFREHGASLQALGLTALYRIPWVVKFLWAPLVDAYATKRRWLLLAEGALVATAAALALAAATPWVLAAASAAFLAMALMAATHDIAVDGFYLESLDRARQAAFVGYQAMAYRLALIAGSGWLVAFAGVAGWPPAFLLAAGVLLLLLLFHAARLPRSEAERRPMAALAGDLASPARLAWLAGAALLAAACAAAVRIEAVRGLFAPLRPALQKVGLPGLVTLALLLALLILLAFLPRLRRAVGASDSLFARAFVDWLDQPRMGVVLAFLCTYRTGESFLLAMVYPFLKELGLSQAQFGWIQGTFGVGASIAGAILGGHLIRRFDLRRTIWPLVLAQNVPHLLYVVLSLVNDRLLRHPGAGIWDPYPYQVGFFVVMEAFGAGLGTAVFMVYIQRTCKAAFKAAHFSIATSIMNVSTTLAGVLSGFLAASLGYRYFFALTFFITLPSMALIPFLPHRDVVQEARPET